MNKLLLTATLTCILCSCASAPKTYQPYNEVEKKLNETKKESNIAQFASVTLFEAEEQLKLAKLALEKNDIERTDHHIYLAEIKRQIAYELVLKHKQEQDLKNLKQQKNELIAQVRRNESQRAQNQTQQAQQRIKQLEQALGQYKAEETSRGTILIINDLLFATGGASLQAQSERRLEPLLQYLTGNSQREIIIEGHTDSMGSAESNKQLSLKRATAVKTFLVSKGIQPTRIETRGFGEEVPVATNTTYAGRALNRRVEVVIKAPGN